MNWASLWVNFHCLYNRFFNNQVFVFGRQVKTFVVVQKYEFKLVQFFLPLCFCNSSTWSTNTGSNFKHHRFEIVMAICGISVNWGISVSSQECVIETVNWFPVLQKLGCWFTTRCRLVKICFELAARTFLDAQQRSNSLTWFLLDLQYRELKEFRNVVKRIVAFGKWLVLFSVLEANSELYTHEWCFITNKVVFLDVSYCPVLIFTTSELNHNRHRKNYNGNDNSHWHTKS